MSFDRTKEAESRRIKAAKLATSRLQAVHDNNGEESLDGLPANFRKGLKHNDDGFLENDQDYQAFREAILSGDPQQLGMVTTADPPAGEKRRKWESPSAGFVFDLEGPDAQSITMPPAPRLDSDELAAEMAEVYAMAALRDTPFSSFDTQATEWIAKLNNFSWFNRAYVPRPCEKYQVAEIFGNQAGRFLGRERGKVTLDNLFRGVTKGDDQGPYISQFLLIGNPSRGADSTATNKGKDWKETAGKIAYGAQTIDQRVRVATPNKDEKKNGDFMLASNSWRDVQNGVNVNRDYKFEYNPQDYVPVKGQDEHPSGDPNEAGGPAYRFIYTPRDLATYVHFDQLYQAYLNACIIILQREIEGKVPFDTGFCQFSDGLNQEGFAQFGGPHILSLVTEVATRALKAVRYQKFNIHNRARPEFLGGLMEQLRKRNSDSRLEPLRATWEKLQKNSILVDPNNHFLPMAFPEGSPMHPSYGAGHATVAGACVTILKAFFDHEAVLFPAGSAYYADPKTEGRTLYRDKNSPDLTIEGELNKLASNISIGRNFAGVHYFSDYLESLRLGELIAIGILEEQALMYNESQFPFSMTVPLYDGGTVVIGTKPH